MGSKKNRSPHYKGDNRGGYGNPPVAHQFKGQPGPGRPKGSTSLASALRGVFESKVRMRVEGEEKEIPMTEALARRVKKQALVGSGRDLDRALELAAEFGPQDPPGSEEDYSFQWARLTMEETLLMRALVARAALPDQGKVNHYASRDLIGEWEVYKREDGWLGVRQISRTGYQNMLPAPQSDQEM